MFRALSAVCGVIAAGLLGWAGYSAFHPPAGQGGSGSVGELGRGTEEPSVVVEDPDRDLGPVPLGEYPVTFRISNRSDQPGAVVGGSNGCNAACCFDARGPGQVRVPPVERTDPTRTLSVNRAGPFEIEGRLYLRDGVRLRTVRLRITGVGVPPKGEKPHAPPP